VRNRMEGFIRVVLVVVISSCLVPRSSAPQQPVPLDPTPLERPSAATVARTRDATVLFTAVGKVVTDNGFTILSQDARSGTMAATKSDEGSGENYDKVIVWLERDFQQPSEFVNIYFQYGRFEKIFGRSEPARIKISTQDEQRRVGQLKQALLSL